MAKKIKIDESAVPISGEEIEHAILLVRGQKVMLDRDLARLYDVETKALNRAVQRNLDRFPADFMFQLAPEEHDSLRFQFGTLKRGQHSKYLPFVFTQEGVAMLSGVRRSPHAVRRHSPVDDPARNPAPRNRLPRQGRPRAVSVENRKVH